jgi:hypothetical protein
MTVLIVKDDLSKGKTLCNRDMDYPTCRTAASGWAIYANIQVGQYVTIAPMYYTYRGELIFDTSTIPAGAIISGVKLQLLGQAAVIGAGFNIVVLNGQPDYPHDPVVLGDYDRTLYSGDGGSLSAAAVNIGVYNDIVLNATGISWINKGGWTKLCIMSSRDISGDAPVFGNDEYVTLGNPSVPGQEPILEVTYNMPDLPIGDRVVDEGIYGKTLKLDTKMDLVFDGSNRLMMMYGVDKVKQDIEVLLRTGLGDDIFHLTFGFDAESAMQSTEPSLIAKSIQTAIMMYRFTKYVSGKYNRMEDRMLYWDLSVTLLSGEEIQMKFGGV